MVHGTVGKFLYFLVDFLSSTNTNLSHTEILTEFSPIKCAVRESAVRMADSPECVVRTADSRECIIRTTDSRNF